MFVVDKQVRKGVLVSFDNLIRVMYRSMMEKMSSQGSARR